MFAFLDHFPLHCIMTWQRWTYEPHIAIAIAALVLVPEVENMPFAQSLATPKNCEVPLLTKSMRECCNPDLMATIVPGFILMQT
jgi:hypothetical protein